MAERRSDEPLLDAPVNQSSDAYARARYLSQQFVEELCSIEGMPALINEIERVIFEAHPSLDRDGAIDFDELLDYEPATIAMIDGERRWHLRPCQSRSASRWTRRDRLPL